MRNTIFGFGFYLFIGVTLIAQRTPESELSFALGLSQHSIDDVSGVFYGFNYSRYFSNNWAWIVGFEGTLNDSPDIPLFFLNPDNGTEVDATLHNVTAGFQLVFGLQYDIFRNESHKLYLNFLPLLRYQSTSIGDVVDTLFPPITGLAFPVRNIIRLEPARTFGVGGSLRLGYSFSIGENWNLGVLGAFQGDTNGDTLPSFSLRLGRCF